MNLIDNNMSYTIQISINQQPSQQYACGAKEKASIPPFHTLQPNFVPNLWTTDEINLL